MLLFSLHCVAVSLHCVAAVLASLLYISLILELEVLLLERNGVVEEELRSVFESIRDGVLGEILVERTRGICEHEGNVFGRVLGEDGRQSRKCRVGTNSGARDGTIGKDENSSDGVGLLLNLSRNTFCELILWNAGIIGEPRCVEDTNLRKRLVLLTTSTNASTYHYAVVARKFVNAGRCGLALAVRTTLLVGGLENVGVIVINIVAAKDIAEEFQSRGLADTSLPEKKDGVWCFLLRYADESLLESLYLAKKERESELTHQDQDRGNLLDSRRAVLVLRNMNVLLMFHRLASRIAGRAIRDGLVTGRTT